MVDRAREALTDKAGKELGGTLQGFVRETLGGRKTGARAGDKRQRSRG
jgi:hypothetical protein